jgi:hypothetical protein
MAAMIDTTRVANRRSLHFDTVADILHDVESLNRRRIKSLGNWSGGQILKHLAIVMNGSIDGVPMRFSWPLRLLGRMFKRRILTGGMSPGYQLKGKAAEVLVSPPTSWADGLQMFRHAVGRLQSESKREPSPFFGPLTREEWDRLHCRHAELHLSFLVPEDAE